MTRNRLSKFKNTENRDQRIALAIPYLWLILFFLIPFILIFKISFSKPSMTVPPFQPLMEWTADGMLQLRFNLGNYFSLFVDQFYTSAFVSSLTIALISTVFCVVIGYFIAYAMVKAPARWRPILLLLIMLPFWTSFLVRVYAWIGLLSNEGIINNTLIALGWIDHPLHLLHNKGAVILGIIYCYLPFAILPIYAVLDKIDPAYWEAAYDLGCRPWKAFWQITVPLSWSGLATAGTLVFIPAMGEFVIPELLGAPDTLMIGRMLWMEFFNNRDWPLACALAVVVLIVLVVPLMILQRHQNTSQSTE